MRQMAEKARSYFLRRSGFKAKETDRGELPVYAMGACDSRTWVNGWAPDCGLIAISTCLGDGEPGLVCTGGRKEVVQRMSLYSPTDESRNVVNSR